MKFVNRAEELELLRSLWKEDRALVVIYGRRRIGKTRLMQEFAGTRNAFFFTFSDIAAGRQLREFRERAAEYLGDDMILKLGGDWYDTLRYFFRSLEAGTTVVLDEFTYAIKSDRKILSDVQKLWDGELRDGGARLLICGSMLGMVQDEVLSHTSPLYGRRTGEIHLGDLKYEHSLEFFDNSEYGITAYMLVGGMPEYLQVAARYGDPGEFVTREFLNTRGYFYREPYYMLSQDLKDMKVYFAILNAMAAGNTRPGKIANFVGIGGRAIYPYLETLQRLEFVRREVPLGAKQNRGIYRLSRPMIYSWFNLIYAVRQEIESGTAVFQAERLNRVLGTAFESLCTEFIAGLNREEGWGYDRIGRWWHREEEIDMICLDTGKKRALLCEVKYGKLDGRGAGGVLDGLARKMELTPWSEGWKVEYCVLAGEIRDGEKVREELEKEQCRCYEMRDIIG